MKILVWLCVFQFLFLPSQGQSSIDSLRAQLRESELSNDVNLVVDNLSRLAWQFYLKSENDSAIKYYNKALTRITPGLGKALEANIMTALGAIYASKAK